MPNNNNDDKTKQLIETGTELAGAAVGSALGFLAGGPIGAAGAGALGVVIAKSTEKLIGELANRHLSHREEVRIGATAAFALSTIQDRLDDGDEPRDDGFFAGQPGENSSAEEIFEGILLKSKNEHEEKKIRLLGNFFANLAFSPEISAPEANYLLKVAEDLTYRQMCLLALFYLKPQMRDIHLRDVDYSDPDWAITPEVISLVQEMLDMYNQGLMVRRADNGSGFIALLGWGDIAPDLMVLTSLGEHLAMLLNFDIDNLDTLMELVAQLQ